MAASLVGGAAVGAVFGELLKAVLEVKDRAAMFKPTLTRLQTTLESISPLIKDLSQFNDELGRSPEEIVRLTREMEEGTKLVCQCSNINPWNCLARAHYGEQLMELDYSIVRFFCVDMQAQIARDQKETLLEVRKIVEHLGRGKLAESSTAAAQLHLLDSKISHSERKEEIEAVGPSMGPLQPNLHGSESNINHLERKEEIEVAGPSMGPLQPNLHGFESNISHLKRKEEIEVADLSMGPLQPNLHGSESNISHSEVRYSYGSSILRTKEFCWNQNRISKCKQQVRVRLVACPQCAVVLIEPAGSRNYICGGCYTVLQAQAGKMPLTLTCPRPSQKKRQALSNRLFRKSDLNGQLV